MNLDARDEVILRVRFDSARVNGQGRVSCYHRQVSAAETASELVEYVDGCPEEFQWAAFFGRHGWLVLPGPGRGSPRAFVPRDEQAFLSNSTDGLLELALQRNEDPESRRALRVRDRTAALLQVLDQYASDRPSRLTLSWTEPGAEPAGEMLNRLVQVLKKLPAAGARPSGVAFLPYAPGAALKEGEVGVILQDIVWPAGAARE
ncbi:MAG: hypothetical protein M5U26_05280 [Planctomycetota bacterium]|nr:hypothetical protein [Planctomycetota bacterium]